MTKTNRWIIDLDGTYIDTPDKSLTGFSDNTEEIVLIAPFDTASAVSFGVGNEHRTVTSQYMSLSADVVSDWVDEAEIFGSVTYQDIADWHVWRIALKAPTKAYVSKFRGGFVYFSFRVGTIGLNSKCLTDMGTFGADNLLPTTGQTTGDYYACEDLTYTLTVDTKNDVPLVFGYGMYTYWGSGEYWVKVAENMVLNTVSHQQAVDPSFAVNDEVDEDEINYLVSFESVIYDHEARIDQAEIDIQATEDLIDDIIAGTQALDKIVLTDLEIDKAYVVDKVTRLETAESDIDDLETANMVKSIARTGSNLITITYYNNTTATVITLAEFRAWLGNATNTVAGLMSAQHVTDLETLMALFDTDADDVVNTIAEILAIFEDYPEGVDLVSALNGKVDKTTTVNSKALSGNIVLGASDIDLSDERDIETVILANEGNIATHETRIDNHDLDIRKNATDIKRVEEDLRKIAESDAVGTVADTDVILMPKNTARGIVKPQIDGMTLQAEQLVENGDMLLDEDSNNIADGFNSSFNSNIFGFGTQITQANSQFQGIYQEIEQTALNKYYYNVEVGTNSEDTFVVATDNVNYTILIQELPLLYNITTSSGIYTLGATIGSQPLFGIQDRATSGWGQNYIEQMFVFNISTLIANKQYSPLFNTTFDLMSDADIKTQMDAWVQDGTLPNNNIQSVSGDKRLTSKSEDELTTTELYLQAPKLYGYDVRDSIEYRNGKMYHIKRVDTDHETPLDTPIETEIVSSGKLLGFPKGTIYVDHNIVAPQITQYTSNAEIADVTKPIATLDKIIKLNADGSQTVISTSSGLTIAGGGLSFTHTALTNGDYILFSYFYEDADIVSGLNTITYYNDDLVKFSPNGTAWKLDWTVDNDGVATIAPVEVV